MARLGTDRGPVLRVRQINVPDGEVYAVSEADFIEGAFDPAHYDILGYNEFTDRPELDASGRVVANGDGTPKMVREYKPMPDAERVRVVKASAAERKDAHTAAREANPELFRVKKTDG